MPPKPFKFVLIADAHLGTDKLHEGKSRKLSSRARSLLQYFVTRINDEIRPAFVVQLGDLIEEDEEEDEENYVKALGILKQLSMPVYHVVGNHEQVNLKLDQVLTILKYPKLYYSFDSGDYHFVVLFASCPMKSDLESPVESIGRKIQIDTAQRKWLEEDLNATKKATIVFLHHPLDDQDLAGSYWFEQKPDECFVDARNEIREIFSRSGKVIAVFNGHVHRNNLENHDDIWYVSLQSLVENMSEHTKTPAETIAIVTVGEHEIRVEIEGMDPAEYRVDRGRKIPT